MSESAFPIPPNIISLLDSDEKILWQGNPSTKLFLFSQYDIFLVPFSLVWGVGAILSSLSGFDKPGGLITIPFSLLFFVVAIYVLIGRFYQSQWARKKTVYCVSNKRAFIATNGIGGRIETKPLQPSLAIALQPSEPGSITLGEPATLFLRPRGMGIWTGNDGSFTFRKIPDANKVYALIRSIQSGKP